MPSIVRASVTCWRWTMQLIVFRALLSESFRCRWVCRGTAGTLPTTQILNSRSCLTTLTVRLPVTTTAELRWLFVLLLCVFVEFCRWQAWLIVLMHCLLSQVNVCYTNCTVRKSAVLSSHAGAREIELNCMSSLMVYKQLLQYVGHVGITGLGQLSLASFRGR